MCHGLLLPKFFHRNSTEKKDRERKGETKMLYNFFFIRSLCIIVARTFRYDGKMIETPFDLDKSFNEIEINNSFLSNVYEDSCVSFFSLSFTLSLHIFLFLQLFFTSSFSFVLLNSYWMRLIWWKFFLSIVWRKDEKSKAHAKEYGNVSSLFTFCHHRKCICVNAYIFCSFRN